VVIKIIETLVAQMEELTYTGSSGKFIQTWLYMLYSPF